VPRRASTPSPQVPQLLSKTSHLQKYGMSLQLFKKAANHTAHLHLLRYVGRPDMQITVERLLFEVLRKAAQRGYGFLVGTLHSSMRVFSTSRTCFHWLVSSLLIVPARQADLTRFCVVSSRFPALTSASRAVHVRTKFAGPRATVAWINASTASLCAARAFLQAAD
jgi:hypothetical protein